MAPPTKASSNKKGESAHSDTSLVSSHGNTTGKYTWQEVAKHNTPESLWVIIDEKVYDVTQFLDKHPGGREMMLLSAGRDCTHLFQMYHCLSERAPKYLASYEIGVFDSSKGTEFPVFNKDDKGFYTTMTKRVKEYFDKTGKDPKNPIPGMMRAIPMYAIAFFSIWIMNNMNIPLVLQILAALTYGVFQVLPLMHIMHDASHAAIGHSEIWWNSIGKLTMDIMSGGSMMSWLHQHVVGHHVYTNVFGCDPDLPIAKDGDLRRLVQKQVWAPLYKYQHIYLPLVYGLLNFKIRTQDFSDTWSARMNGPVRVNMYSNPWIRILSTKLLWFSWRIVYPLYFLQIPFARFLILFVISEMVAGYWLAYNFQVSHITEHVAWPNGGGSSDTADKNKNTLGDSWAVAQVKTSLNYAHDSTLTTFLCAALNYQIEHHLFPGISQYHYPALAPIVKQTCKEFNVPYRYENTFADAFMCHIRHLKDMGEQGKPFHWDH